MAESELHRELKRAACRWLWRCGYAAIAEEVEIPGVGIIDAAASGKWKKYNPRATNFDRAPQFDRMHTVFVECKAYRADFLRDQGRQNQFAFALAERRQQLRRRSKRRPLHASAALGKFDTCLLRPHAQMHFLLTPPRLLAADEVPRRWGWLIYEDRCIRVVRKAAWQENVCVAAVEGAIARSLTARFLAGGSRPENRGTRPLEIVPPDAEGLLVDPQRALFGMPSQSAGQRQRVGGPMPPA